MSERWKPKQGERYWVVDTFYTKEIKPVDWVSASIDNITYNSGNCFKTKAEAEAAAEKVKALLLSLHQPATECSQLVTDCNQLPKLTPEVFNCPDCPEWANFAAADVQGLAYWYQYSPLADERIGVWKARGNKRQLIDGFFDRSDWQHSLIERPAKLPDWCKVGEWVWATTYSQYFKIDRIDKLFIHGESSAGDSYSVKFENVRQARLRPYNADEMRGLVGKVVTTSSGRHCTLVTAYKQEYSVIEPQVMLNKWLYATDLLNGGNTIDGSPCGVLEHLNENGEWVE